MTHNATDHLLRQMTRRRIRQRDIDLALQLGHEHHAAGATFFVLRKRDIPRDLQHDSDVRRAEGTTVVLEHGRISTVYRNRSIRHLFRKPKRSCRPRRGQTRGRPASPSHEEHAA